MHKGIVIENVKQSLLLPSVRPSVCPNILTMSSIFAGILLDLLHIVKLIAFDGANYLFGALFAGNKAAKLVNYYGGKTVLITGNED